MTAKGRHWYTALYVQVLIAVVLGALVGWLFPAFATNDWVEFLGRGFVKLVKMAIAPLIFCTVVSGIAHIQQRRPGWAEGARLFRGGLDSGAGRGPYGRQRLAPRRELS
jgi:hypothetical protein